MSTPKTFSAATGKLGLKVELAADGQILLDGASLETHFSPGAGGLTTLRIGSKSYNVYIQKIGDLRYDIWVKHFVIPVTLETPLSRVLSEVVRSHTKKVSEYDINAPMPGLIRDVLVSPGDRVHPGTPLIVLEAMKMENEIRSAVEGTVKLVKIKNKDAVEKNQLLIEIEALTNE